MTNSTKLLNAQLSIMIIEDSKELTKAIIDELKVFKIANQFHQAHCFSEAQEKIRQKKEVDMFLVNWSLPDENGQCVIEEIRSYVKYANSLIIVISGYTKQTLHNKVKHLRINDFLTKPWSPKELKYIILNHKKLECPS